MLRNAKLEKETESLITATQNNFTKLKLTIRRWKASAGYSVLVLRHINY